MDAGMDGIHRDDNMYNSTLECVILSICGISQKHIVFYYLYSIIFLSRVRSSSLRPFPFRRVIGWKRSYIQRAVRGITQIKVEDG